MRISGISAYSGIYNMQHAGVITSATAKLAQDTPVEPVPRVTNEASGNASVAAAGSSDTRPSGGILSGVGEQFIKEIEGYRGEFIVESFNPNVLRTVSRARPDILIGILAYDYTKDEKLKDKLLFRLLGKLYLNFLARPDFISYEKSGAAVPTMRYIRRKFDTPLVAWTITSPEEERKAFGDGFDTVIFEGYIPE